MTGIYLEAEELQFHLELGETTPSAPPVATLNTHTYHTHADSGPSWLSEGHVLGGPQGSSHELQPRSPDSLYFVWDHLDKAESSPKIMAAQAMEALNRTFIELKSKNEEIRLRASYDLRDLVVSAAKGKRSSLPCSVHSR